MLTAQMPALTRALSGVLPPAALKQLTQSLGNCNQEMVHRGPIAVTPDAWQNVNNRNGTYDSFPPSIEEYNNFYNNVVSQGDYSNTLSISNPFYNNASNPFYNNASNPFYNNVTNLGDIIITTGGPAGRNGRDGLNGLIGGDGINGIDGREGRDGLAGNSGVNGIDGREGRDGQAGPGGAPGDPGAAGANGRDGRDGVGVRGADGAEGAAGAPGAPGVAGQNGRDGRDGVGIGAIGSKTFVQDVKPKFQQMDGNNVTVVKDVTFDPETCELLVETELIVVPNLIRVMTELNSSFGKAYAP